MSEKSGRRDVRVIKVTVRLSLKARHKLGGRLPHAEHDVVHSSLTLSTSVPLSYMASHNQSSRVWLSIAVIVSTACQLSYGLFYLLLSFLHTLRSRGTVFERDQSEKDLHPSGTFELCYLSDEGTSLLFHQ